MDHPFHEQDCYSLRHSRQLTRIEAVLLDAELSGSGRIVFLGDIVGYGAFLSNILLAISLTGNLTAASAGFFQQTTPVNMNDDRPDALEAWILEWFQRKQITQENQAVARRYLLREFDQLQKGHGVDVLRDRLVIMDPDCPDLGSNGEWVERLAEDLLACYEQAIKEGHGSAYSEVYGYLAGSDNLASDQALDQASAEAYEIINIGSKSPAESPGYQDAYQACISREKNPEFAKYCADHLIEENCSFAASFQVATKFEKDFQLILGRGHSEFRARMYAERMRDTPSTDFAEFYAESVEEQIKQGRNQREAEVFAEIHAGILFDYGKQDEDGLECKIWELHLRAKAEAQFRYHSGDGHEVQFLDRFDRIHQRLSSSPLAGSLTWFDDVEARTKQELADPGSQLGPNGCLPKASVIKEVFDEFNPKEPDFKHMSEAEFRTFHPVTEEDNEAWEAEAEYRTWCEGMEVDPLDLESRAQYKEEQEADSWDDMDENDRDGWTDNMNKD